MDALAKSRVRRVGGKVNVSKKGGDRVTLVYANWIKLGTEKPGKSRRGLAEHLTKALSLARPMHRQAVYKMIRGTRDVQAEELKPISDYIEEPIPLIENDLSPMITLRVEHELSPGRWFEKNHHTVDFGTVTVPRDFEYPSAQHFAYISRSNSMGAHRIFDGDIVIGVRPNSIEEVEDGALVIVKRTRGDLIELSARVAHVSKHQIEFSASSSEKPFAMQLPKPRKSTENIEVVAIITQSLTSHRKAKN